MHRRNAKSCNARVQTRDGVFELSSNEHTCSHFGDPEKVAVLKARLGMLTQANNSRDRTHAIVGSHTQALSESVKAQLPQLDTIRRSIRRVREGGNLPAPHRNDQGFEIPNE